MGSATAVGTESFFDGFYNHVRQVFLGGLGGVGTAGAAGAGTGGTTSTCALSVELIVKSEAIESPRVNAWRFKVDVLLNSGSEVSCSRLSVILDVLRCLMQVTSICRKHLSLASERSETLSPGLDRLLNRSDQVFVNNRRSGSGGKQQRVAWPEATALHKFLAGHISSTTLLEW